MCISLLYECMKNSDICYCISVIVICLLYKSINAFVHIQVICFPLSVKLSTGFLIRVGTGEDVRDLRHTAGPAHL